MKTEKKHTPGPWMVGRGNDSIPRVYRKNDNSHKGVICQFGEGMDETRDIAKNYEANARLIAAAPELLHELKELRWRAKRMDWNTDGADAAIAKAEGK